MAGTTDDGRETAQWNQARPIPILLYHGVADDVDSQMAPWVVRPEVLDRHLGLIAELGLEPVTVGDLVSATHYRERPLPEHPVVVTFDDGFADFADGAFPVLEAHGVTSTLYVVGGHVGDRATWLRGSSADRAMLDWSRLREMADSGVEIGAHTLTHPHLDLVGRDEAWREIEVGREVFEAGLERPVRTFAYPHGHYTGRVRRMVAAAGYESACAVGHGLSSPGDDRYALTRIMVRHGDSVDQLRRWLSGLDLTVSRAVRGRARSLAGRQVRRVRLARKGRATAPDVSAAA